MCLDKKNVGWAKGIRETLVNFLLTENFQEIKEKSVQKWKKEVYEAGEFKNLEIMKQECYKCNNGNRVEKSKSKAILAELNDPLFNRKEKNVLLGLEKNEAKCIIMARYGMLMCGNNFKTLLGGQKCKTCDKLDDENHRLNECHNYENINWVNKSEKIDFGKVYSNDREVLKEMARNMTQVWTLTYGSNVMRNTES